MLYVRIRKKILFFFSGHPVVRVAKMTIGWSAIFSFGFTRGLYNQPGFVIMTREHKPDFRTIKNSGPLEGRYRDRSELVFT